MNSEPGRLEREYSALLKKLNLPRLVNEPQIRAEMADVASVIQTMKVVVPKKYWPK